MANRQNGAKLGHLATMLSQSFQDVSLVCPEPIQPITKQQGFSPQRPPTGRKGVGAASELLQEKFRIKVWALAAMGQLRLTLAEGRCFNVSGDVSMHD